MPELTKRQRWQITRQLAALRRERKAIAAGERLPWGVPWCDGPGSPYHQELLCESCPAPLYCADRAAELDPEIQRLAALLAPAAQESLW